VFRQRQYELVLDDALLDREDVRKPLGDIIGKVSKAVNHEVARIHGKGKTEMKQVERLESIIRDGGGSKEDSSVRQKVIEDCFPPGVSEAEVPKSLKKKMVRTVSRCPSATYPQA